MRVTANYCAHQKHSPRLASRAALKGVDCEVEDKDAHDEQRDEEGRAEAQAGAVLLLAAAGAGELLHPLVHLPPGALDVGLDVVDVRPLLVHQQRQVLEDLGDLVHGAVDVVDVLLSLRDDRVVERGCLQLRLFLRRAAPRRCGAAPPSSHLDVCWLRRRWARPARRRRATGGSRGGGLRLLLEAL
eukprot:Transcript_11003.p3 GENE.Transcript_11003~~Transcript_11003.p3  ORF type:complete len:197 (-),score=19.61 Transcript_11003:1210-1767(-)